MSKKKSIDLIEISPWYETEPIPKSDQPFYNNAVFKIKTELNPYQLLEELKKIEKIYGRKDDIRNASRVLDLDILFFENVIIKNENLIIPHPRLLERRFVLEPFCDINPNFKHTILKKEIKIYLSKLSKNYICKKIFD